MVSAFRPYPLRTSLSHPSLLNVYTSSLPRRPSLYPVTRILMYFTLLIHAARFLTTRVASSDFFGSVALNLKPLPYGRSWKRWLGWFFPPEWRGPIGAFLRASSSARSASIAHWGYSSFATASVGARGDGAETSASSACTTAGGATTKGSVDGRRGQASTRPIAKANALHPYK